MRFNSRCFRSSFSRMALKRDLHAEFAEFKALLALLGTADAVIEIWNGYARYV